MEKRLDGPTLLGNKALASVAALSELEDSCYVCGRIDRNLSAMIATAVYLWESDLNFRKKFERVRYFCLPHYKRMIDYAQKKMNKKLFRDFYEMAHGIEKEYMKSLRADVSWFCKKFDYRYDEEPWYNAKDALPRAEKFLSGDLGHNE